MGVTIKTKKQPSNKSKTKQKHTGVSFLKRGAAARQAIHNEQVKAQKRDEEWGKARRFYLPRGAESIITFLDGNLDDDGVLDAPLYYEHQANIADDWKNWFVCIQETEPCPLCQESGNKNVRKAALVAVFTIIDHSEFKGADGTVYKDTIRLYAVKQKTLEVLQKQAQAQDGLTGCTFEVSRTTTDNSPASGDVFIFQQKNDLHDIKETYPEAKVLDYEKEITYRSAEELAEFGFGVKSIGNEKPLKDHEGDAGDYENDL